MKARLLSQVESMIATLIKEGNDDMAVVQMYSLIALLRKDRIEELEKRLAALQLQIRYKRTGS